MTLKLNVGTPVCRLAQLILYNEKKARIPKCLFSWQNVSLQQPNQPGREFPNLLPVLYPITSLPGTLTSSPHITRHLPTASPPGILATLPSVTKRYTSPVPPPWHLQP